MRSHLVRSAKPSERQPEQLLEPSSPSKSLAREVRPDPVMSQVDDDSNTTNRAPLTGEQAALTQPQTQKDDEERQVEKGDSQEPAALAHVERLPGDLHAEPSLKPSGELPAKLSQSQKPERSQLQQPEDESGHGDDK